MRRSATPDIIERMSWWNRNNAANAIPEGEEDGSAGSETEAYDISVLGAVGGSGDQPAPRVGVPMGHPHKRANQKNTERDNRRARRTMAKEKKTIEDALVRQAEEASRKEEEMRQRDLATQQIIEVQNRTITDILRQNEQTNEALRRNEAEMTRNRSEMDRTRLLLEQA